MAFLHFLGVSRIQIETLLFCDVLPDEVCEIVAFHAVCPFLVFSPSGNHSLWLSAVSAARGRVNHRWGFFLPSGSLLCHRLVAASITGGGLFFSPLRLSAVSSARYRVNHRLGVLFSFLPLPQETVATAETRSTPLTLAVSLDTGDGMYCRNKPATNYRGGINGLVNPAAPIARKDRLGKLNLWGRSLGWLIPPPHRPERYFGFPGWKKGSLRKAPPPHTPKTRKTHNALIERF